MYMLPPNASCNRSILASSDTTIGQIITPTKMRSLAKRARICAKANRGQGRCRIEDLQLYDGDRPAALVDGYIRAKSAQNRNEVRGYGHAEIEGHCGVKSLDMHLVAEPLMKTQGNEATQEALGKFVVVSGFRDGPVSQNSFRTEFDDSFLEVQTMSPVEEP
jgi:hypothetical protein